MRIFLITLAVFIAAASNIFASGAFPLDDTSPAVIGAVQTYTIKDKETLIDLARTYGVGFNEIADANRLTDPWTPARGSRVTIPTTWLLPEVLDDGIIINLAEMRLYYFFAVANNKYVSTFPIGIGVQGFNTPSGMYRITAKIKDPVWRIPKEFRDEYPDFPDFVPPGPDNPLGGHWLQLSVKGYGIHGTNRPLGIGRRVSHGCIRLYPEDIESLFNFIKPGTPVKIIDEPVKAAMYDDKVYLEIHSSGKEVSELMGLAVMKLSRKGLLKHVDTELLINAIKASTGLPAVISN